MVGRGHCWRLCRVCVELRSLIGLHLGPALTRAVVFLHPAVERRLPMVDNNAWRIFAENQSTCVIYFWRNFFLLPVVIKSLGPTSPPRVS
jgi:hypothetical protein